MTLVPLMVGFRTQKGRGTGASVKTLVSTGPKFFIDLCRHLRLNIFWLSISFSSQIHMHIFRMCKILGSVFIFLSFIPSYPSPSNLYNLILLSVGQSVCVCVWDIFLLTYHWIRSSVESPTKSDKSRALHSFWAS